MTRATFVLVAAALAAFGQTTTSSIVGTVTDPSGAVVPNVNIVVTNVDTGIRSSAATDSVGNYTVTQLPPGRYQVEAELPGFKKFVRQNVTLEMTRQLRIDVALETGAA